MTSGLIEGRRSSFFTSLAIQRRVIGALLLREVITRFGRRNIGVLWLVVEPMTFTLGVTAFWTLARLNHGSSLPIVAFAITGYSSVLMWRNTVSHCNTAVRSNFNLLGAILIIAFAPALSGLGDDLFAHFFV